MRQQPVVAGQLAKPERVGVDDDGSGAHLAAVLEGDPARDSFFADHARDAAAGLAAVSAIVNFVFLPAYPVWAVIVIALDLIVVFALLVHGGELRMGTEHY